jgi:hypothetical protein
MIQDAADDLADKVAELAGLSDLETNDSAEREEAELSDCFNGSPGCGGTDILTY